jgi:hypothetical protein
MAAVDSSAGVRVIDAPRRARLVQLVALARTTVTSDGNSAAYELTYATVPSRRLDWLITELTALVADRSLPCERRGQLAEAIGSQLQYSKRRKLTRRAVYELIDLLGDPCPQVRFWSAFSLGTLRAREARRALAIVSHDPTMVEGWWSVGAEAADALAIIDGTTTDWRMADRAGATPSE